MVLSKASRKNPKESPLVVRDSIKDMRKIAVVTRSNQANMFSSSSKGYWASIDLNRIDMLEIADIRFVLGCGKGKEFGLFRSKLNMILFAVILS